MDRLLAPGEGLWAQPGGDAEEQEEEAIAEAVAVRLEVDGPDGEATRKKFEDDTAERMAALEKQNAQMLSMLETLQGTIASGFAAPRLPAVPQRTRRSLTQRVKGTLTSPLQRRRG